MVNARTIDNRAYSNENQEILVAMKGDRTADARPERAKEEQRKADKATIDAINQIDGVHVDEDVFKEDKGFDAGDLNPFKWIFKPITDMQKRVIHLEKQMMRLEGPIAGLQKPMNGLRQDMIGVRKELRGVRKDE